jgi:hypothetical protein
MAWAPPMPISIQPMTLPARRTISAPRVAYKTVAGAKIRPVTASPVARSFHARIVKIRLATESTVMESHTMAVARLEPVAGAPSAAPRPASAGGAAELTCVTTRSLWLAPPRPVEKAARDAQDE